MNSCKRLIFIILILSVAAFFTGCTKDALLGYDIFAVKFHNDDNSGTMPVDAPTDTIAAKAYAIRMEFFGVITTSNNGYTEDYVQYNVNKEPWRYNIYSLTDFDAAHPAMASLQDYFNWLGDTSNYLVGKFPMYGTTAGINFPKLNVGDTGSASGYLLMMKPPATLGVRQFVVNVVYTDSTSTFDTITVNLY